MFIVSDDDHLSNFFVTRLMMHFILKSSEEWKDVGNKAVYDALDRRAITAVMNVASDDQIITLGKRWISLIDYIALYHTFARCFEPTTKAAYARLYVFFFDF